MTDDKQCPVCLGAGGWQQHDGSVTECPRGCMEPRELPTDPLRDELVAVLAEHRVRMTSTGDGGVRLSVTPHEEVVDALLPVVARALTEARADELEQAAHLLDDGDEQAIEVALGGAPYVHRVLCDRATALRASIRQTDERNDR